jgi:hypothetical protein
MVLDKNEKVLVNAGYSQKLGKNLLLSHAEIIANFEEQEKTAEPHLAWYDYKTGETSKYKGFLIWSLWDYGCGVAHRRDDGEIILITGWQSDFCYC